MCSMRSSVRNSRPSSAPRSWLRPSTSLRMCWWTSPMSSSTLVFATPRSSRIPTVLARLRRPGNLLLLASLVAFLALGLLGDAFAPVDPLKPEMRARLQGPSAAHLMGTDPLGRDVFSRVLVGAQLSVQSVIVIIATAVGLGTVVGAIAGYAGGWVDDV